MILVGWRFFVAALATLPLVLLHSRQLGAALFTPQAGLRDASLMILIGLLQTAAVMELLFWAMKHVSASTAAILHFTHPIWVVLFGRVLHGEPLRSARLAGLLLGFMGVALALALGISPAIFSHGTSLTGEIIGLASALCWAIATLVNKRAALPFNSWALSFWQMMIGALAILILAYSNGLRWPDSVTAVQWGWFLWLAIPASTGSFRAVVCGPEQRWSGKG
ncbi:DMT family transporter [Citrobacter freundii]|uniref:EamA domain-containing protein n=2 Tax=Pseudomonadota TaxID=1224 RepID=A0A1L7NGH8_PSEPU|nr:DMT family transporter [Citrobacter freundii]MCR3691912.1 DMT family transporter [Citrobacter freundii]MCR3717384.1 DMT family transporter [Citrobacter freundii]MDZ3309216.1 DMT family transporter [Klebsiella pneumoniae]BAW24601.1 Uncharacterized protein KF715C_ch40280 [Pseudomonas putida]